MNKVLFAIIPLLALSGCKSLLTTINDAFPVTQPKAEPLYFTVERCPDDLIEDHIPLSELPEGADKALLREMSQRNALAKLNCVDPNKYEKLELSDRCRYKDNGELECAGSVNWILDPANYKVREGAIQERERIRAKFDTVEITWEYTSKEGYHTSEITTYNLAKYKDKLDKLKQDKRCTVQRKGKKFVCKMKPTADFPVHRGMLPAAAYRGW